jgi:hypothetical protein
MDQEPTARTDRAPDEKRKWYVRPWPVIFLLFFVAGPLALPLLYKSPAFSKTLKVILTVVVLVYTAYLVIVSIKIGQEVFSLMDQLQEM